MQIARSIYHTATQDIKRRQMQPIPALWYAMSASRARTRQWRQQHVRIAKLGRTHQQQNQPFHSQAKKSNE